MDQPIDTYRIKEFGEWFLKCETHDELTKAAKCAALAYADEVLTDVEYRVICGMGRKRREELSNV